MSLFQSLKATEAKRTIDSLLYSSSFRIGDIADFQLARGIGELKSGYSSCITVS